MISKKSKKLFSIFVDFGRPVLYFWKMGRKWTERASWKWTGTYRFVDTMSTFRIDQLQIWKWANSHFQTFSATLIHHFEPFLLVILVTTLLVRFSECSSFFCFVLYEICPLTIQKNFQKIFNEFLWYFQVPTSLLKKSLFGHFFLKLGCSSCNFKFRVPQGVFFDYFIDISFSWKTKTMLMMML